MEGIKAVGFKAGTWKGMHVVRARRDEGTVKGRGNLVYGDQRRFDFGW